MDINDPHRLDAAEAFSDKMLGYLDSYEAHLGTFYTQHTVRKHTSLIGYFIEQLCVAHTVTGYEQITSGMCGSRLVRSYNSNCSGNISLHTAKNILYRFFQFMVDTQDILHWPLLQQLK